MPVSQKIKALDYCRKKFGYHLTDKTPTIYLEIQGKQIIGCCEKLIHGTTANYLEKSVRYFNANGMFTNIKEYTEYKNIIRDWKSNGFIKTSRKHRKESLPRTSKKCFNSLKLFQRPQQKSSNLIKRKGNGIIEHVTATVKVPQWYHSHSRVGFVYGHWYKNEKKDFLS